MNRSTSWQSKIDPAFDHFIQLFLEMLDALKLPANEGYIFINPDEPIYKLLEKEGFPGFIDHYSIVSPLSLVAQLSESMSDIEDTEKAFNDLGAVFTDVFKIWQAIQQNQPAVVKQLLTDFIGNLRPDSKEYYMSFVSSLDRVPDNVTEARQLEMFRDIISNIFSLFMHKVFFLSEKNRDVIKEIRSKYIQTVLFLAWDIISISANGRGMKALYDSARAGNDKSLCQLVKIDKTLFDHDWVRERIRKAMYSGDITFFRELGKAVQEDPLKDRKVRLQEFAVLTLFWDAGLYKLSVPELIDLLNDSGLTIIEDETTFRKFIDRFQKIRPQLPFLRKLTSK